jgi:hypothetical protein
VFGLQAPAGVYPYRLLTDPTTGAQHASLAGRLLVVRWIPRAPLDAGGGLPCPPPAFPSAGVGRCRARAAPLIAGPATAGTTGRIAGRVVDAKKQPLPGVTVAMVGLKLGP